MPIQRGQDYSYPVLRPSFHAARDNVFVGLGWVGGFNLPVDKVGSAINGVNDPSRGICQSTLFSPSDSLLSNEAIIHGA